MNSAAQKRQGNHRVNLRSIALPAEHGGWGFLLEPIVLGLLLAATWQGVSFSLAMLTLFLIHQPLKVFMKEQVKQRLTERGVWARRFVLLYGLLAAGFGLLALLTGPALFLVPVLVMVPLMLLQAWYDFRSQSRALLAELAGAVALGGIVSAIVLLGGWEILPALALWAALLGRTIPSILYVRAKLRSQRGEPVDWQNLIMVHGLALIVVAVLAWLDWLPWLAAVAMILLGLRAWLSLRDMRTVRASRIGIQEMFVGLATVLLIAAGFAFTL